MKRSITLIVLIVAALLGCTRDEVKTVDYYKAHDAELKAKLQECANNPGQLAETPNCKNAGAAAFAQTTGPSRVPIR